MALTSKVTPAQQVTPTYAGEFDNGNGGAAAAVNWLAGAKQKITLNAATCVVTFGDPTGVANVLLRVIQDGAGGRLITWPASVKWAGGAPPVLTAAAAGVDVIAFYFNGANYYGVASLNFA